MSKTEESVVEEDALDEWEFDRHSFRAGLGAGKEIGYGRGFWCGVIITAIALMLLRKAAN